MDKKIVKIERNLPETDLPAFLRELADYLENPQSGPPPGTEMFGTELVRAFSLGIRRKYGRISLKLKVQHLLPQPLPDDAQSDPEATAEVTYSGLKKRMKRRLRSIGESISAGRPIPAPQLAAFVADSELMVEYEGYGDEHYARYLGTVRTLADAAARGDTEAIRAAHEAILACMRDCHARND
ncbi:XXXCH domain-containing protein [Desulfobaculum xiamenense]|uniref:XXXCH domain-containing protein n=1 Tax=Desulfobaculum xiamenense TaxID=995050 RepID=A0A846QY17_9BACT|nr:GAK system XXXCH domain-containing protein [Desulfobaculum xiamenense]NJB69519.1 XXXCH domain-containing protein [Desulfobaculum xiamenense]